MNAKTVDCAVGVIDESYPSKSGLVVNHLTECSEESVVIQMEKDKQHQTVNCCSKKPNAKVANQVNSRVVIVVIGY